MQLVILAGGKGTRLGLADRPKPMVEINKKPLLEHQILLAKEYGIKEIFILSSYKAEIITSYFKDGKKFGIKIHHIIEETPLGTAGALKTIEEKLEDRFLVFYGDIYMDFDIKSFIEFDKQHDSVGTLLLHPNDHPEDSDLVEIDKKNIVKNLILKPHNDIYYTNLVNAAVFIFSKKIFNYINKNTFCQIEKDIIPTLLENNETIIGYKNAEYVKDVGTPLRLKEVTKDIVNKKTKKLNKKNKRPCIFLDRDGVINEDMKTNPTCESFKLLPQVIDAIRLINQSEYLAIIVTNQPMIAKGFVSIEEVETTHKKLETILGKNNAYLNAIYYCPHHPERGFKGEIKKLKFDCNCRKPKIGMLEEARNDFNIDIENSWIIGDSEKDIQAGNNFGCKTISVQKNIKADYNAQNILDAVKYILSKNKTK